MNKKWNGKIVEGMVKYELDQMGLGHFSVELVNDCGRDCNQEGIKVTTDPTDEQFGYQVQTLDRYFSIDGFMSWFEGRKNYLKLSKESQDVLTEQRIHPQVWEENFLKSLA